MQVDKNLYGAYIAGRDKVSVMATAIPLPYVPGEPRKFRCWTADGSESIQELSLGSARSPNPGTYFEVPAGPMPHAFPGDPNRAVPPPPPPAG